MFHFLTFFNFIKKLPIPLRKKHRWRKSIVEGQQNDIEQSESSTVSERIKLIFNRTNLLFEG